MEFVLCALDFDLALYALTLLRWVILMNDYF